MGSLYKSAAKLSDTWRSLLSTTATSYRRFFDPYRWVAYLCYTIERC